METGCPLMLLLMMMGIVIAQIDGKLTHIQQKGHSLDRIVSRSSKV